ncbi:amidohydrolase family protein [Niveispirillum sp. SYP-B3756]|uniref:amidohydrolase family protein n=1 Tax=Niveispirillum sp. SYP-B3756 TaxID=2662178 RepID=UPI00129188BF|nr:amidohydrolase family protein [Niveispirillum sp. SYP-B3756]MQP68077.1 amidohydrolase family protein [Niveispirillum sp. SYP-B3756]
MSIIDAHQHFWDPARGDYGWLTPALTGLYHPFLPADLRPLLDAAGIAGTILIQAAPTAGETDYMLGLAAATPWIKGVVGWIDLDAPDAADQIKRRRGLAKFVGIRPMLQDLDDPAWILAPGRAPALAALEAAGLAFDALVTPAQLACVPELARRYPDLRIIINHGAKAPIGAGPLPDWHTDMVAAAGFANVSCKLSGLLTEIVPGADDAAVLDRMGTLLDLFGPRRLIWGSDWPVLELAAPYDHWHKLTRTFLARLSPEARAAIMGGNAMRIYRLEGA